MSKSGRKYRDPHNVDAHKRKAGPHEPAKRKEIERARATELDHDIDSWRTGRPFSIDEAEDPLEIDWEWIETGERQ